MALIWMFSAILIIAGFTASVTSTLTVSRLESMVNDTSDLQDVRVATVTDSTSSKYLARQRTPYRRFETVEQCMVELADGNVDAVVYDATMLQYLCLNQYSGVLAVLPNSFEKQDYAIALRQGSELREPINQALLEELADPTWLETQQRYLGSGVE